MPSVEFIVDGTPVSAQTKNDKLKADYCQRIARAALRAMADSPPFVEPVRLDVRVFYSGGVRSPDNDNVTKLLQDVLESIVYINDAQIDDTVLMRRDVDEPFRLSGVSTLLACALTKSATFMYVRVTTAIDRTVIE
jgi:hypothetical protein